ncbi:triose-phosphate isomerase [Nakamurella lactea]|uniref:triose-phosphate isomerase n=1 Tax=Nakamurella lactea TaxID=459515 RepID=UPI00041577E7|nr:triose-phosphate isomerase [Nakamurella lactea]
MARKNSGDDTWTGPGRQPLIAGNWKMNLNHLEAIATVQKIAFTLPEKYYAKVEVAVLPPFTDLRSIQTLIDGDKLRIRLGAQDLSPHPAGAYTGDIAGSMLAKLGVRFVTVGHSERREYHAETDDLVGDKAAAALANGITPILCVGEGLEDREAGIQIDHAVNQLLRALDTFTAEQAAGLVLAYEPIWAIGTGRVATAADAQEVCGALRAALAQKYSPEVAAAVRILYGGSVKAGNVAEIIAQPDIDGALVGGASLDATEFATLAANAVGVLA